MKRFHCLIFLLCGLLTQTLALAEELRIAAASNLRFVMTDLVEDFSQRNDSVVITVSYGASGNLTNQIRHGAPYDIFFAADTEHLVQLDEMQLLRGDSVVYADNHLALFARLGSSLTLDVALEGLANLIENKQLNKFAIANPKHAPFGQHAMAMLKERALWEAVQPHLLMAENVSQALQFALTGQVDGALVAYSLARHPKIVSQGRVLKLSARVSQAVAILKRAPHHAEEFVDYLGSRSATQILEAHGFSASVRH